VFGPALNIYESRTFHAIVIDKVPLSDWQVVREEERGELGEDSIEGQNTTQANF
jgi:hypothetical protein